MSLVLAIDAGTVGTASLVVADEHTAPRVGSGQIHVLATPVMINLFEAAALAACEHLLPAGHQSLGTHLDVSHIAATPVGMRATATAEVLAVEGRTIKFGLQAKLDSASLDSQHFCRSGSAHANRGRRDMRNVEVGTETLMA